MGSTAAGTGAADAARPRAAGSVRTRRRAVKTAGEEWGEEAARPLKTRAARPLKTRAARPLKTRAARPLKTRAAGVRAP